MWANLQFLFAALDSLLVTVLLALEYGVCGCEGLVLTTISATCMHMYGECFRPWIGKARLPQLWRI